MSEQMKAPRLRYLPWWKHGTVFSWETAVSRILAIRDQAWDCKDCRKLHPIEMPY